MTTSPPTADRPPLVSPVIDYEPAPVGLAACRAAPTARRRAGRSRHRPRFAVVREPVPPPQAVTFANVALRRVLEVIDRRRPVAQVRALVAPTVFDTVVAVMRGTHTRSATLRRVRLRMVDADDPAAEVFGTYTRGERVQALAARIVCERGQWRIVALQFG
jgi:hypothetical protein